MLIQSETLSDFVRDIFAAAGCSLGEAERIAQNLVDANLTGHDSHGVIRTGRYLTWIKTGNIFPDQELTVVSDSGSLLIVDGNHGFGQTVGPLAVQRGIDRASELGVSIVALRHAGHLGRIGAFAEAAVLAGQVSVHFVNVAGSLLVAPFGGTERRMSTAPVAIGVPVPDGPPVILDFATSLVAEGKVLVAALGGKPLPDNALVGPDGKQSGDPKLLYGDSDPAVSPGDRRGPGAIRAMGEHKGSGLALMCELLAGALTGSKCTGPDNPRVYNGMLSIYMSVDRFDTEDLYASELRRYIDYVKGTRPAEPGGEVLVPGEPEQRKRAERLAQGILLPDDVWQSIVDAGAGVGVSAPEHSS